MNTRRTHNTSNNVVFGRIRVGLRIVVSLLMLAPLLVQHVAAQDEMPETMAYQGYLTDTAGDPANGTAPVVFRLYDRSSGGTALWQETQQGVLFTDGVFSVHLGSVENLDDVPFGGPLWLGVSVAGSQELTPRVALETVPYAMSVRGLRVESVVDPDQGFTLNMIGGHPRNEVADGVYGATVSGGGVEAFPNQIAASLSAIGGGANNIAGGFAATISGGTGNEASDTYATVSGGTSNTVMGKSGTIGGGSQNEASGQNATVGGGESNTASGSDATVSGGHQNVASQTEATVGGGSGNEATEQYATVSGGTSNTASLDGATVGGGEDNTASGDHATVGGGDSNTASGSYATVPGGTSNEASGDYSVALGQRAKANHDGTFVWADNTNADFASTDEQQFLIQANSGVGIGTNAPQGALHVTDETINIDTGGFSGETLVIEGNQPVIGLYASFQSNTRPGLVLAGVDNGNVVDKWGIVREFFSGNALHFTYGLNEDHTQNPSLMILSNAGGGSLLSVPDGIVSTGQLRATDSLGASGTPFQGSVYQDNMVYAWAHVNGDGSVSASYGCTVSKAATGSYRVSYKRQLPNGASAIVTAHTVNDPIIATAVASANQASVATKVFNGTSFVPADSGFYIQVVGRP